MKMKITGIIIFLVTSCFISFAQNVKVSGTVSDDEGPLIGAFVNALPVKKGTMTDVNGKYSILVPLNSKLQFSFTGYETVEAIVKKEGVINIQMKVASRELTEVVVVGYGTVLKRDLTGAITSIKAEELVKGEPINIANALQGKVSGFEIVTSSEPGAASNYRVRGASTLSEVGSNPLFIVDDVEVDRIDDINPQDIASVEVLRDAASAAIYGSKSANGVVLITTKKGSGNKPTIRVNYSLKQTNISKKLPQMNRREGIDYEILRNYLQNTPQSAMAFTADTLNPSYITDNHYQDMLFRTAYTNQLTASISGEEKKLKYYVSSGYTGDNGIQVNTYSKTLFSRINIDYKATNKLAVGNRLAISGGSNRMVPSGARNYLLSRPASMPVVLADGTYAPVMADRSNPLAYSMLVTNDNKNYNITFNEFIEYDFIKGLKLKSSISGSLYQNNFRYFQPSILVKTGIPTSKNTHSTNFRWNHEDVLTYNTIINKNHSISSMVGLSLLQDSREYLQLSVSDNISEAIETSSEFETVKMTETKHAWSAYRMASFFGRVSYSYKGRYLFNSNLRYDGSSRFGSDKRWGTFPSASLGWRFSDEKFMKWSKSFLVDAKLRYSYGKTGNQAADNFAALSNYTSIAYADYVGIYPVRLENNTLGWEDTQQHNWGTDLSLFKGKVNLNFDYYNKKTRNVLFNMKLPGTTGFATSYSNIGGVENKGVELTIATKNIKKRNIEWSTSLNFAVNKNKLVNIPEEAVNIYNDVYLVDNGYTLGTMYGYRALQIFSYNQSNAFTADWTQLTPIFDEKDRFLKYQLNGEDYNGEVKQLRYGTSTGEIFKGGDVMWQDINGDGVIDAKDRQVIGSGQPDLIGGFNSDFRYKAFTLSTFFSFSLGGDIYNSYESTRSSHMYSSLTLANPVNVANSWKAPGDIAKYPIPSSSRNVVENTRKASSLWVEDGSYIRLKTLKLAYSLPKSVTKALHVKWASCSLIFDNYLAWSNYTGFDPEIISRGFAIGYDNNSYPRSKSIVFGLNVTF